MMKKLHLGKQFAEEFQPSQVCHEFKYKDKHLYEENTAILPDITKQGKRRVAEAT